MAHRALWLLAAAAVGILAWLAWHDAAGPAPADLSGLTCETAVSSAAPFGADGMFEGTLTIRNRTGIPVRVTGCREGCFPGGCVRSLPGMIVTVAPGQEAELTFQLKAMQPGQFDIPCTLFFDAGGVMAERTANFTGTAATE